jgi:2,4-dienoyl-CoA reductase (NADPH2)
MADACVRDGVFDFWEVCRPLLADPELIHKAAEDRLDEVRPCIGSLNCLSRLFRDLPYTCTMNPALGHEVEPEYQVTPAAVKKKVMVIGAGPAGMECAITAAKRGHDVTVFDKAARIGGNLYAYAMNDLARPDDLLAVISHYEVVAKKLGLDIRLNTEVHEVHAQRAAPVRRLRRRRGSAHRPHAVRHMEGAELMLDASTWPTAASRQASAWW